MVIKYLHCSGNRLIIHKTLCTSKMVFIKSTEKYMASYGNSLSGNQYFMKDFFFGSRNIFTLSYKVEGIEAVLFLITRQND